MIVITSYSIHYTKLYEDETRHVELAAETGMVLPFSPHLQHLAGREARITSYNVCYTKLLRDLLLVDGHRLLVDLAAAVFGQIESGRHFEGERVDVSYNFV